MKEQKPKRLRVSQCSSNGKGLTSCQMGRSRFSQLQMLTVICIRIYLIGLPKACQICQKLRIKLWLLLSMILSTWSIHSREIAKCYKSILTGTGKE